MSNVTELQEELGKINDVKAIIASCIPIAEQLSDEYKRINTDILEPIMEVVDKMAPKGGFKTDGVKDLIEDTMTSVDGTKNAFTIVDGQLTTRKSEVENELNSLLGIGNTENIKPGIQQPRNYKSVDLIM